MPATAPMSATGGFAPKPRLGRRGSGLHHEVDRGRRLQAGRETSCRPRCGLDRILQDGKYVMEGEGKTLDGQGMAAYLADLCKRYRSCRSRTAWRGRWAGWKALTDSGWQDGAARRRRSVRHQPDAPGQGIKDGIANAILVKVNQIGTLTETMDARLGWRARMLRRGDVASLGRDRRHDHRDLAARPIAGRSRPARCRAPTPGQVQPAAAHRGAARQPGTLRRQVDPQGTWITHNPVVLRRAKDLAVI